MPVFRELSYLYLVNVIHFNSKINNVRAYKYLKNICLCIYKLDKVLPLLWSFENIECTPFVFLASLIRFEIL